MTNEQATWLREHSEYEIVGDGGAGWNGEMVHDARHHKKMGSLEPNGIFRPMTKPVGEAILVGIRHLPERETEQVGLTRL